MDSGRTCQIRIIWQGGASTEIQMTIPASGKHGRTTSEDTIELIRRLAPRYNEPPCSRSASLSHP